MLEKLNESMKKVNSLTSRMSMKILDLIKSLN